MSGQSLGQLLTELSLYLQCGDDYLRQIKSSHVKARLLSARRLGVDVRHEISAIVPEIRSINRLSRQFDHAWFGILLRCSIVLLSALVVRMVCGHIFRGQIRVDMEAFDRVARVISILSLLILSLWGFYRYLEGGWNPTRQRRLWFYFEAYLGLRHESKDDPEISKKLQQISQHEMCSGLDTSSMRKLLLKETMIDLQGVMDSEVRAVDLVAAGIEMIVYVLAYVGFVSAPVLMWLESASGMG